MGTILVLVAVTFFVAAIIVGSMTNNSWRNVGITYALLVIGIVFFSIALTINN